MKPPACIITGGETTVTLRGGGLGGRNQEFVLAAAIDIAGLAATWWCSAPAPMAPTAPPTPPAPSPTATPCGAIRTRRRYLERNDSYHYFESLGDLVITGPTNTNVMDVRLVLVGSATVSFWRKEVVDFALSEETRRQMDEQRAWIEREPANPRPYYNLAQFYRMEGQTEEALGLLLEAVRLDAAFADAHVCAGRNLRGARRLPRRLAPRPRGGAGREPARGGIAEALRGGGVSRAAASRFRALLPQRKHHFGR